jgi:hypothetical protein
MTWPIIVLDYNHAKEMTCKVWAEDEQEITDSMDTFIFVHTDFVTSSLFLHRLLLQVSTVAKVFDSFLLVTIS